MNQRNLAPLYASFKGLGSGVILVVIQFLFKISSAALWSLWATTDLWAGGGQRIHRCPWPVHRSVVAHKLHRAALLILNKN